MIWWILFAVFLFILCAVLFVTEIFVPSFGLISVFALACLAGGIAIFFKQGDAIGWTGILTAAVIIPVVFIIAYKIFPKTSFGQAILMTKPKRPKGDAIPDTDQLKSLLGKKAVVNTPLRPVGMCDFNGQRLECVAESGYVDKGKTIEVIKVEGTQLTVREIENS
ncbi:MAG: hypothetical protein JW806_04850 [Sedimentisphaerales bacterium]|nr:hypothetical protein [Sedimentisphaerales bacterium]